MTVKEMKEALEGYADEAVLEYCFTAPSKMPAYRSIKILEYPKDSLTGSPQTHEQPHVAGEIFLD